MEQKKRPEEFSSTQTFSVTEQSAPAPKPGNRTQNGNHSPLPSSVQEQSAQHGPRGSQNRPAQPQARAVGGTQAQAGNTAPRREGTAPVRQQVSQGQVLHNTGMPQNRPISSSTAGSQRNAQGAPVRRPQQPVDGRTPQRPLPVRGDMPGAQNPTQNRAYNMQGQNRVQNRADMQPRMHTRPEGQSGASNRPVQARPANGRPAAQNGAAAENRRVIETRPGGRVENRAPARKNAVVPASASKPVSAPEPKNRFVVSAQRMLKTRDTDIAAMKTRTDKRREGDQEVYYSGEGGNTVISMVKAVVYIIFVLVISAFLSLFIINVGNDIFAFVKSDEIVEVEIPEYATLDDVADILYQNDIIKYPTIFKMYAVAQNSDNDFLAGTYSVNGMMNYDTLLGEFKEKPETGTVDITIPEGYTIDEMIDLFVDGYGIGTREGFVDVIQNGEFDYWFIDELEESGLKEGRIYRLEGYLFPDTYQFYKASSEWTVVNKMLKRFSQIFTKEYRAQCEVLGYTVDEVVTLASLIEKEAESPAVFFTVSSVFHNRMNRSWEFPRLESDATVAYWLSHEKGERSTVTAEDLHIDTPYNTYLYEGFPPSPIANPSASAMLAALQPQQTNYYFFVAYKGTTKFSATKAEHEAYLAEIRSDSATQQTTGDVPAE